MTLDSWRSCARIATRWPRPRRTTPAATTAAAAAAAAASGAPEPSTAAIASASSSLAATAGAGAGAETNTALAAVGLLQAVADAIAYGGEDATSIGAPPTHAAAPSSDADRGARGDATLRSWLALFGVLRGLASDRRPEIRHCALQVIVNVATVHGSTFGDALWGAALGDLVLPLIEQVGAARGVGRAGGRVARRARGLAGAHMPALTGTTRTRDARRLAIPRADLADGAGGLWRAGGGGGP